MYNFRELWYTKQTGRRTAAPGNIENSIFLRANMDLAQRYGAVRDHTAACFAIGFFYEKAPILKGVLI